MSKNGFWNTACHHAKCWLPLSCRFLYLLISPHLFDMLQWAFYIVLGAFIYQRPSQNQSLRVDLSIRMLDNQGFLFSSFVFVNVMSVCYPYPFFANTSYRNFHFLFVQVKVLFAAFRHFQECHVTASCH